MCTEVLTFLLVDWLTIGDYIEGKLVTDVDELKGPDCGNATEETERMLSLRSQTMLMKILMTWTN